MRERKQLCSQSDSFASKSTSLYGIAVFAQQNYVRLAVGRERERRVCVLSHCRSRLQPAVNACLWFQIADYRCVAMGYTYSRLPEEPHEPTFVPQPNLYIAATTPGCVVHVRRLPGVWRGPK